MQSLVVLIALALFAAQEKPSQEEIRSLVVRLRSDSIEQRVEAGQRLVGLGQGALPEL